MKQLIEGLRFPESPRWGEGCLWFSEKRAKRIVCVDNGTIINTLDVPGEPGGLGWDPEGRLLVVSMGDQRILRLEGHGLLKEFAHLSELVRGKCNDMVVDQRGRAYVGDFGYDLLSGEDPAPGHLVMVDLEGSARLVADDLGFPNGVVIHEERRLLIVAESAAGRLTAFTVDDDGGLRDRRIFAELGSGVPDGICLDAEGAVWYADPLNCEVVRVEEGGRVLQKISTGQEGAFACVLGGQDGRNLYVCTYTESASVDPSAPPVGSILLAKVDVPTAGSP